MPLDPQEQRVILNTIEEIRWVRGQPLSIKTEGLDTITLNDVNQNTVVENVIVNVEGFIAGLLDLDT